MILLLCLVFSANAEKPLNLYLFHGETCPHCHDEIAFLNEIIPTYPEGQIVLNKYEVWNNEENADFMDKFAAAFGFEASGVPLLFIGEKYFVGFSESIGESIREQIDEQIIAKDRPDTIDYVEGVKKTSGGGLVVSEEITLPIIGKFDLSGKSSLAVTTAVGLADGVNPCSLWVLTMLLTIVIHTDSRKKSFIVGFVYIFVTAAIYALFILGVFSLLDYVKFIPQIQMAAAAITLVISIINIKDYFFYKQGVSLTIDDSKKPGLYAKMRNIVKNSDSLPAMIGATVALSAMVSLIEFSCTAAFPVIWSNILTAQGVTGAAFYGYLLLYMFLYQLDEIIIFIAAVITMKSKRVEEKHGRFLKLFSGCMMLVLSVVMLMRPELMNDLLYVLFLFAGSIASALIIHFAYSKLKKD